MNYFVTGATGYIGAHLVKRLTSKGHTVHALVRNQKKAQAIKNSLVELFEGDLMQPHTIDHAMQGCDYVFHLAAFAKVWAKESKIFFDQNVKGTTHVLEAAIKNNVKRCVFTSTAGVLGPSFNEAVTEKSSRDLDFFSEYESSKALSESKIKDYVNEGLDVVIVSPTRVYGPYLFGQSQSVTLLVEKFIKRNWRLVPGNGKKTGNYIFIDDVVQGHLAAMEKGRKGHTYILGGTNHNYFDFFDVLKKVSGIERSMIKTPFMVQLLFSQLQLIKTWFGNEPLITPKWINKGRYNWSVSPAKAVEELGLKMTPLDVGLKATIDWIHSR